MLDRYQRQFVQRVKEARSISVVIDGGLLQLDFRKEDIHKLAHDIAIAIQDYFVKSHAKENNR